MLDYSKEDFWPDHVKHGWTAAEFDAEANTHTFTPDELDSLLRLVETTKERGLAVTEITRELFDSPELHDLFARLVRQLKDGQGILTLKGFPVRERDLDDIWRMYWGIGTHVGIAVSQDLRGILTGQVMVQEGANTSRVYGTSTEAVLHADRIDVLALLCINRAKSGGENGFASSLAIWDIIEQERPDLFARLHRGFPQHRTGEEPVGHHPITPYRVPVFGEANGLRSVYMGSNSFLRSQQTHFEEMLEPEDIEALEFLESVKNRPELQLPLQLQPGEAVFLNNLEVLHSRAAFVDGNEPHEKRRLLRLWLQGRPRRPIPVDMNVIRNPSGNLGIEPRAAALEAAE